MITQIITIAIAGLVGVELGAMRRQIRDLHRRITPLLDEIDRRRRLEDRHR